MSTEPEGDPAALATRRGRKKVGGVHFSTSAIRPPGGDPKRSSSLHLSQEHCRRVSAWFLSDARGSGRCHLSQISAPSPDHREFSHDRLDLKILCFVDGT